MTNPEIDGISPVVIDDETSMSDPDLPYLDSEIDGRTFYHGIADKEPIDD